ncbi:MAG: DKNYY domain-containing protein [Saprospiraceae bacterium]|nr:DKNYY domain-containing protein [Saprospiraceae bacterium]
MHWIKIRFILMAKKYNTHLPNGFVLLSDDEYGYSKDKQFVFFNNEVIINAAPATFEVIQFPYSKDKNDVYCGTVPMKLSSEEVLLYKVTNEDKLMAGMISTTKLSHFLSCIRNINGLPIKE